jgi:hypothetical protein
VGVPNRGAYNYFQASLMGLIGAQSTPSPVFRALSNGIGGQGICTPVIALCIGSLRSFGLHQEIQLEKGG